MDWKRIGDRFVFGVQTHAYDVPYLWYRKCGNNPVNNKS